MVLQGIRGPKIRRFSTRIEDLAIELTGNSQSAGKPGQPVILDGRGNLVLHHVAVDDLSQSNMPTIWHEIEGLCLNTCRVHSDPFQVILAELRVCHRFCLLTDGTNC